MREGLGVRGSASAVRRPPRLGPGISKAHWRFVWSPECLRGLNGGPRISRPEAQAPMVLELSPLLLPPPAICVRREKGNPFLDPNILGVRRRFSRDDARRATASWLLLWAFRALKAYGYLRGSGFQGSLSPLGTQVTRHWALGRLAFLA